MTTALYVDTQRGPYLEALGADRCWGVERDARTFDGAGPVVAHPPCSTWGKFWWQVRRHRPQQFDALHSCGPRAVEQVRRNGGVLEHPEGSRLWAECGLPRPGAGRDEHGGYTVRVEQCDWGHVARKPTWLYIVGCADLPPMPADRLPTHCMVRRRDNSHALPECPKRLRHITPPAFAAWLLEVAARCA